ncbi:LPS-assembly protein LptD [Azoarcus sp. KH32C]|uniref:LPS-assembly protein LptD n=1 Tax=Azoarcus sp. KH32C TaxID=748247 RepID=UPI0002386A19|nr:LPS-assembly protein LptD [Azoarcus sp. KH32C]BAL23263.1 organic solvent tolerance transmembrane protein [Azoarcus sp. KH32C]
MRELPLRTQLRLIPLLLCCISSSAMPAGLGPLVVSPDLVREGGGKAPVPSASPATAGQAAPTTGAARTTSPAGPKAGSPGVTTKQGTTSVVQPVPTAPELEPGATEIRAEHIRGTRSVETIAEGNAEVRRDDMVLTADRIEYREIDDEVHAVGNVRLKDTEASIAGPEARMKLTEHLGQFDTPDYWFKREPHEKTGIDAAHTSPWSNMPLKSGSKSSSRQKQSQATSAQREVSGGGHADVMYFQGENQYELKNATWSTCQASDPDWYIKAPELHLDYDREVGEAHNASIVFKDVPLLWWPWADFPLVGQRQSGFLSPTFGVSNKVGLDISIPYYWNIAPNYDATIAPRFMGRRGTQLATEFRYLTPTEKGESRIEWLPRDNVTGEDRALGSFQHQQILMPGVFGSIDVNGVSDKHYFEDLSSRVSLSSRATLLREGRLSYATSDWWNASAVVQSYQTLSGVAPYQRLPQLTFNANRNELAGGTSLILRSEFVQFRHVDEDKPEGNRLTLYPQVALPYERAGYFVTPKFGVHYTHYDLDNGLPAVPGGPLTEGRTINRTLPIFTLDSGLIFERDTSFFDKAYVQTLEPRLYYVRVPTRNQDEIPVFDSARYDFGLAQIFSENLYSGGDRIADANQVTAAVTSRLVDGETGAERLRATVGQRFYFDDQQVTLPGETPRTGRRADILGVFSGRVSRSTSLDSAWQYNPRDSQTERFNFRVRYSPDIGRALNLSYRYSRDVLQDLDLSGQWPLGGGWYGVGRITRSLKENRITESIAGIEYDGGCWVFRAALHRFATNPEDVTQAFFVQLEFNGLTSVGSSPINLLRRSVAGYGKINDPVGDRIFGTD